MKSLHSTNLKPVRLLLIILIITGLFAPACCLAGDISLFVQQTPDSGGAVNPAAGVYHFAANSQVTLTAKANPGYQFVYWLGDVSDPQAENTVVHLDAPKVVIAVFEQNDSVANVSTPFGAGGGGGGGGGLVRNPVDLIQPAAVGGASGPKPTNTSLYGFPGKKPVVPEPATGLLLGLGSLIAFTRRRRKKS
jgi:hypothetical protein